MPQKFFTAPNQHRLYSDLQEEPGNTAPPPFPGALPLLPLPKIERQALCLPLYFSLARIRTRQRGTAAPRAVRVVGRVRASGTQATSRPRRQPRQVLLPLPECVSPDLAKTAWPGDFSCLNWSGYGLVFRAYVASGAILSHPSSTVFYRRHPLQHLERTRLRLLSSEIGCVSLFFPLLDVQNFRPCFCALCRIAFTD